MVVRHPPCLISQLVTGVIGITYVYRKAETHKDEEKSGVRRNGKKNRKVGLNIKEKELYIRRYE
jgi:hypothetical protein